MRVRYYLRKYKRSPYWYYRLTVDGERIDDWRSTGKRRKADAAAYAEREAHAVQTESSAVSLLDALTELAAHKERKGASDATMEILSLKSSHLMAFFGADRDVRTLTVGDTTRYLDYRRKGDPGDPRKNGVSDSTIEKELRELRAALRHTRRLGWTTLDPAAIWPPALRRSFAGRTRWLPREEYLRLLAAIDPRHVDHLIVYCNVGLRRSELYRLTGADLRGDTLHVRGTKTEGADRVVPLSPDPLEVLERRKEAHPVGPLFAAKPNQEAADNQWARALRAACIAADIEHASTNDLRRTFVSWAWQAGVDLELVRRWVGHSSLSMIRQVYGQSSAVQGRAAIGMMPSRLLPRRRSKEG